MTSLNALLKELAKPTDALQAALGGVSIETDGLQAVMQQLELATGGNFTSMTQLFGSIEATKAAMVLGNDAAGIFDKTLGQMDNKSTVLAQNFELMAKNTDLAMQKMVNSIQSTLIAIGNPLLDEFGTSLGALSDIFKTLGIEIESGALKPLEDALEAFAQNATDSLAGMAKALPNALGQLDFSGLISSFENLGGVFEDVFGQIFGEGLDLSKPEDLARALQTAVNIAESFVNITGGIIKEFDPIFSALGEAGSRISGTSAETEAAIGKFLGAMTLLGEFGTALGALAIIVNETGTDVSRIFDLFGGSAKTVVNVVQAAFDLVVGTVIKSAAVIATAFEAMTPDIIGDPWGEIADDLTRLGDAVGSNFARNMSEAGDGVKQLGEGLSLIDEPSKDAAKSLDNLEGGLKTVGDSASDSIPKIRDYDAEVAAAVVYTDDLTESSSDLARTGGDVKSGAESAAKGVGKLSESAKLAVTQAFELEKTLSTLASNEKIAAMKFTADIEVAKIEGQAKQVVAAFDSIGSTIEATSQAVTDLWSIYAGSSDKSLALEQAVARQESLQLRSINMQERLINQQIVTMQAQADALNNDTTVHIESSGLEKDIEAFMFEILKRIQLKVAGDKSAFLLGL